MGSFRKSMKYAVVLGTRPEIIKMSPVIRELENRKLDYFVVHSGQHYSENMDGIFFKDLNLPAPKYNLRVGSGTHGKQTGKMLGLLEEILAEEKPRILLVQGDTNTVLAGALAACKLQIQIGHIEAGLRSYDRRMPEEKNRVITDHISDYLFVPTEFSRLNLRKEGIINNVFVVGNTVVDATLQNLEISRKKSRIGKKYSNYILLTMHREENVDNPLILKSYLDEIAKIPSATGSCVYFCVHPRTKQRINSFSLGRYFSEESKIKPIDSLGYLDMIQLISNSRLVLTDSGGLQEESNILHVPCLTLRTSTERPETIDAGSNILVGDKIDKILPYVLLSLKKETDWTNPYGDGTTSKKIIDILENRL